ncbi:MAG: serine hydrolase [Desulfocapsaceae bacterium]|nr:serine hydrolase [Desulfocapsaceae bacterium]
MFIKKNSLSQRLYTIFSYALDKKVFPGAAIGISLWNGNNYDRNIYYYGLAQTYPETIKLTKDTFFDLASLTKVLTTIPALLSLMEEKKISWNLNLAKIFQDEIPKDKSQITIKNLMSHCSGLPAHNEYYNQLLKQTDIEKRKLLFTWILQEKLIYMPGTDVVYSDLGFILLGFIIEKISGKSLDEYVKEKIYKPLLLQNKLVFAQKEKREYFYAATEKCPWTGKMLSGMVHDDNCRAMGGVAGHAGLFGTIEGVVQWCEHLLSQVKGRSNHPSYGNENLRKAVTKEGRFGWTSGFDTPSVTGSSSGQFFSASSFGHLGFTGTSFWIDPQKELLVVLLTNRVHPSKKNELIKKFRPFFHNTVMRCLCSL